uniref:Uncharacterized protein n=1 Tax=Trypanosoma vivax (strain Y486) TaxID=1055687 RepID=G0U2I4_TRYVY|nr:conserved hypothetical protein [Trypanosoma vivax Y486]
MFGHPSPVPTAGAIVKMLLSVNVSKTKPSIDARTQVEMHQSKVLCHTCAVTYHRNIHFFVIIFSLVVVRRSSLMDARQQNHQPQLTAETQTGRGETTGHSVTSRCLWSIHSVI